MIIYGEPSIGLLITIVIVVSIFIGVGIKNWLEDRKDKIKIELANAYVEKKLTEAKEIIKYLLSFIQKENYKTRWDINIAEAEKFIKEVK